MHFGSDLGVVFSSQGDDRTFARLDFLQVAERFLVKRPGRDNDDRRGLLVDHSDGAVLHFRGGVAFGVNVGNFLQLECAFKGNREVVEPAQEEEVLGRGVLQRDFFDDVVLGENLFDLIWNGFERADDLGAAAGGQHADAAHQQGHQRQHGDL